MADYLATINLSSVDHWPYELKTLPRPNGRDTRAIVTEYDMVRPTTEPHDILVDKEGNVWYSDFGEMFIGKFNPKSLKLTEYPIRKFKDKAPTGLLSIEFDHVGKIWFDTMYQGSLGCLDPKTGEISYYPLAPEYNDDRVQLNSPDCTTRSTARCGPRASARRISTGSIWRPTHGEVPSDRPAARRQECRHL